MSPYHHYSRRPRRRPEDYDGRRRSASVDLEPSADALGLVRTHQHREPAGELVPPRIDEQGRLRHDFPTIGALLDYAEHAPIVTRCAHETGRQFLGVSREEALAMARVGWPAGAEAFEAQAERYIDAIGSRVRRPEPFLADTGESVDIGAFLSGEPEAFIAFRPEERQSPAGQIMSICLNSTVSGGLSHGAIIARGAALVALAAALERAGRSVRIVVAAASAGNRGNVSSAQDGAHRHPYGCPTVIIKQPDQPLDLAIVAFWLAHPAAFRAVMMNSVWLREGLCGLTCCGQMPADIRAELECDVFIETGILGQPQWDDPNSAAAWIVDQLKQQGVTLTD